MARPKSDPIKRFKAKVKQVDSGCHEWQSTLHRDGYGKFYHEGKQAQAHRVAFELFSGPTHGRWVLHKCDNRKCVNPDHLFLGNSLENIQDMDAKGRRRSRTKLTAIQAEEVQQLLMQRYSQEEVGKMYGVSQDAISRIKRNVIKIFKH